MLSGLECLKCVHEHGCPWNKDTCVRAAEFDRLDCLEYAIANGCDWDPDVCGEVAEAHGYHEMSQWIRDRGGSGGSIAFRVRERKRKRFFFFPSLARINESEHSARPNSVSTPTVPNLWLFHCDKM